MNLLHDPTWQFIITISTSIVISVITASITIWLALRVPITLPVGYETVDIEAIRGAENIKAIKEKMQIPLGNETSDLLCLFTFKIWNGGRETIQLPNPTPLIIGFQQGVKILGWDKLECEPDYIKVTPSIEDREMKLDLPFLDSKQSITIQVLLSDYANDFPYIRAEVPGRKRYAQANNVRSSRENKTAGIIAICIGIFCFLGLYSSPNTYNTLIDKLSFLTIAFGGYFLIGIAFLWTSHIEKISPPHHKPLLSERIKQGIKEFLSVLPALIVLVLAAIAISFFFGERVLAYCIMTLVSFLLPISLWYGIYNLARRMLKKLKISYKPILIIIVAGIIPAIILMRIVPLIVFVWTGP